MSITNPATFTRGTSEGSLDDFNRWMRTQPWWTQIRGTGTGNFTDSGRAQIAAALAQQGIPMPAEFHIDEGGNLNQKSRVKGRLLKGALIGGGAAAALFGIPGVMPGLVHGGASAAATGGAQTFAGAAPDFFAPPAALSTGLGAAGGGASHAASLLSIGDILGKAVPNAVSGVSNYFAQRSANNANTHAADLQAKGAQDALDFAKQQEDERKREFEATQAKNYALYQEQQQRMAPYRSMGQAALGQMMRPIPRSNTLGNFMGRA